MIKSKFGQAKCTGCGSWHWALNLDDFNNIKELKCCRCNRLIDYQSGMIVKGGNSD